MNRAAFTLSLLGVFLVVNFGLPTWQHWRTTRTTGFRGVSGKAGSPEWFGGLLFGFGIVLAVVAPIVEAVGLLAPLLRQRAPWVDVAALVAVVGGIAGTSWAQSTMGESWRIGVQQDERTEFVLRGPFRWVRNPIFTFIMLVAAGLTVILTNAASLGAFVSLLIAVELQVRFAEEPYLRRTHGSQYRAYCQRVGRFIPRVGREHST